MNFLEKLVARLSRRKRARGQFWDIPDHLDPKSTYLSRYYLMPPGRDENGKRSHEARLCSWFNVFLHQFHRSDDDSWHNHPWSFWISIVLVSGYWEHTPSGKRWRRPGSIAFRSGTSCHRVELDPSKPKPWTLFIPGPKTCTWGFFLGPGVRRWIPYWMHLDRSDLVAEWFRRRRTRTLERSA